MKIILIILAGCLFGLSVNGAINTVLAVFGLLSVMIYYYLIIKKLREKIENLKNNKKSIGIPFKVLQAKWEAERKWDKKHPFIAKLKNIWWWIRYGIWNKIEETPRNIKYFIQRGKKGYSDCDVWGFDCYLARVISEGIDKLIKDLHGHPGELKNLKQWKNILKKISKTFKTAIKIQEMELTYIATTNEDKIRFRNECRKYCKKLKKKNSDYKSKVMTERESLAFEEGFYLFQTYFFGLWD